MWLKEIGKLVAFSPSPPPPATIVQQRPQRVPGCSRLHLYRAALSPMGQSGPHTANQNGGDLYRYGNETGKEGHMGLTISDYFYLFKVLK